MINRSSFFILIVLFFGCQKIVVPKPKVFLDLNYPEAVYQKIELDFPFKFDKNKLSTLESINNTNGVVTLNLNYQLLNARVNLSYHALDQNLAFYISEAEFTTTNLAKTAYDVSEREFENNTARVFGKFYEMSGPVASQSQFYATDSSHHFLAAVLYFKVKPNYDSIFPAVGYIKKDMTRILESLEWKN